MIGNRLPTLAKRAAALRLFLPQNFVLGSSRSMSGGHDHHVDIYDKKWYPPNLQPAHMDDFPVPKGDWFEHNAKLQKRNNMQLIVGLLTFLGTVIYMIYCPEIDMVTVPKRVGINPPYFSAYYKGPRRHGQGKPTDEQIFQFNKEWYEKGGKWDHN